MVGVDWEFIETISRIALRSVRMFFSVYPTLFCTLVALVVLRLTVTAVK